MATTTTTSTSLFGGSNSFLLTVLLLLATTIDTTYGRSNVCLLCEDGLAGLQYPHAVIKKDGTTCTAMALDVAMNFDDNTNDCIEAVEGWRQICCGDTQPIDVRITEPVLTQYPDIDSIQTLGKYDKCDVCRDGDYPSASSMVINMLYIGEGTCPQYWKIGQQGLIPNHLCDPLKYFAYEPCGCGEFSTNGNYNWGESYSGDTPNSYDDDDEEEPWWAAANGEQEDRPWWQTGGGSNSNGNDDDDGDEEEPWWAAANGEAEDRPWWAGGGANSLPGSSAVATTELLVASVSLLLSSLLLLFGLV